MLPEPEKQPFVGNSHVICNNVITVKSGVCYVVHAISYNTQQQNCLEKCFLWGSCRGYRPAAIMEESWGAGGWCEREAEQCPLLEGVTRAVMTMSENTSLCVTGIHVITSCVLKHPLNVITSPNPICSHSHNVTIYWRSLHKQCATQQKTLHRREYLHIKLSNHTSRYLPGNMKESATHSSITPYADTSATKACILTETASFSTPLAVWHLKQRHTWKFVNLTKRNSRHVQRTY
jgi:hypothetical protein